VKTALISFLLCSSITCCNASNKIIKADTTVKKPRYEVVIGLKPYNPVRIARVTGNSLKGETLPNPNQTAKNYDLGGTDLGIMWAMGNGRIGMFFGDTFGSDWTMDENGNDWRSNVLAFAGKQDLNKGLKFSGMAMSDDGKKSRQIIYSQHDKSGNGDFTSIPTGAIRINGVDYVSYMNVRKWEESGQWKTNYSGMYQSIDDGKTWTKCVAQFAGDSHFAQTAFAQKDSYVYMVGIGSGRFGPAYAARFLTKDILNHAAYQYWTGKEWTTNDEKGAASIFGGIVGEPSLAYNSKYHLWMVTYVSMKTRNIELRTAPTINGPWGDEQMLVKGFEGLYGGMIYPYGNNGDSLYFVISIWPLYNVFWMKAELRPVYGE